MPSASEEERHAGVGEATAVVRKRQSPISRVRVLRPTEHFHWIKPSKDYALTQDDCDAIMFLFNEWDWGGIVNEP